MKKSNTFTFRKVKINTNNMFKLSLFTLLTIISWISANAQEDEQRKYGTNDLFCARLCYDGERKSAVLHGYLHINILKNNFIVFYKILLESQ